MGPSVGETICGRIRIEAEAAPSLGATAFGAVRRATLVDTSEELWLTVIERKLVPSHVDLSRFMAGANALLGVRHPALVRVALVDREADYCVIGFEALPGARPLADLIETHAARPLLDRAAVEVARGLAHLHRSGRMHGALGPGAVLVWEGVPMLWQYGLAELCDSERFAVQTRRLGGDLVAPEVRKATPLEPRADVYAWGALMAEIVVGARGAEAVTAVIEGDVETDEHAELLAVVRTALDPDPEGRPLDAVALLERLQATVGLPGRPRSHGVGELARRYLAELAIPDAERSSDGDPFSGLDASIPLTTPLDASVPIETTLDGPDPIELREHDELDAAFGPPIGVPLEVPAAGDTTGLPPLRRSPQRPPLHAAAPPLHAAAPPLPRNAPPPRRRGTELVVTPLADAGGPRPDGVVAPNERGLTVPVRRHATVVAPPPPPIDPSSLLPPRRPRNVGRALALVGSVTLVVATVVGIVFMLRMAGERGGLSVLLGLRPAGEATGIAEASAHAASYPTADTASVPLYACPEDMAAIDDSACIDRGEFPGLREIPRIHVALAEARAACVERGRRLCTSAEWRRACMGPGGQRRFPYGNVHEQDACNEASAAGVPQNLSRAGARDECRTDAGVFDLAGNVAEWVEEGVALGGDATTQAANCHTRVKLNASETTPSLGFRCCVTLAE